MNYLQNFIYRSPSKKQAPIELEENQTHALVPVGNVEHWKEENKSEWEKWIHFQAQLYKRHENRLWFLRDQIQDVNATGSRTAIATDKILDYIFQDLNPWRKDIANLIIPMAQCLKDANFDPYAIIEGMQKIYNEQERLIGQNNYLKEHFDLMAKNIQDLTQEIKILKDSAKSKADLLEIENLRTSLELKFQTIDQALDITKERTEEDQELNVKKADLEEVISGINLRFENLDRALDTTKELTEEIQLKNVDLADFNNLKNAMDIRLETLDTALDIAKERSEEDKCELENKMKKIQERLDNFLKQKPKDQLPEKISNEKQKEGIKKEIIYIDKRTGEVISQKAGKLAEKKEEEIQAMVTKEKKEFIEQRVEEWVQEYSGKGEWRESEKGNKNSITTLKEENSQKAHSLCSVCQKHSKEAPTSNPSWCYYDLSCKKPQCKFKHSYALCRFDKKCQNKYCKFRHSVTWREYKYDKYERYQPEKRMYSKAQREPRNFPFQDNIENSIQQESREYEKYLKNFFDNETVNSKEKQPKQIETFLKALRNLLQAKSQ